MTIRRTSRWRLLSLWALLAATSCERASPVAAPERHDAPPPIPPTCPPGARLEVYEWAREAPPEWLRTHEAIQYKCVDDRDRYHGPSILTTRAGQIAREHHYEHGEGHGVHRDWHANGRLHIEAHYEHGDTHGLVRVWHSNGQLAYELRFVTGKLEGRARWWHENGTLAKEGTFVRNWEEGRWTEWHANGQKAAEGDYRNGEKVGEWRYWDERGAPLPPPPPE